MKTPKNVSMSILDGTTITDKSAIIAISAVYDALVVAGESGIPSGIIYAILMTYGCTLPQWQEIERIMVRTKLVTKTGDLLKVNDPKK